MQSASSVFTVGSVLSRTFKMLKENPVVFFTLALIAVVPSVFMLGFMSMEEPSAMLFVVVIISTLLALMVQGAIAYAVFMVFKNRSAVSIGNAVSKGMVRVGTLLLAAFLMGFGVFFGMILLIIPGIILYCMWSVTIPACVVEGRGALDSMKRSAELTKGYRWTVFGLIVIMWVLNFLIQGIGEAVVATITQSPLIGLMAGTVLTFIPTAFGSVMYAVAYYDLRTIKEGVSIDRLANVFD
ncbi:hypothetical protein LJC22_03815 [Desulfosarcina sp. OttesenSCG-928-G10]|nr:hypothetical protein [Desulfosarcina sp. OttesenSCG-928-G10]